MATTLADDFETAVKAAFPRITIVPRPTAMAPDHRWVDLGWSHFYVTVLAPVTKAGMAKGFLLYPEPQRSTQPEVFTDVAPLLERLKALLPE